jgi:glycosidase
MEFHISRTQRDRLDVDGLIFGYTGNIIFANVAASRRLASRLNDARGPAADPTDLVNAGALFAMGMIDELNHALIAHYRKEIDPSVHSAALLWLASRVGEENVERLLLAFVERFPNVAVYRGELSASEWLAGTTEGLPNREAALEELMLLWISNINPAFASFRELFDDTELRGQTSYPSVTQILPDYLSTRPPLDQQIGSLYEALSAPMLAQPDSITGQLEYIRERWPEYLGESLPRVLLAIGTLREEEIAIWMRFHPPGPDNFRHAAPGWGGEGFVGDEFVGYDEEFGREFYVGPDGVRHRLYTTDYQAPLHEYEAFSADQAWMPNVVLVAKSTYVWLEQLSKKYGRHIHRLDQIPNEELRLLSDRGINGLWLIGLWERSSASKTIKRLRGQADAVASAYSLKDYQIAEDLGGGEAYARLRDHAASLGIRLASDMVPNHMGIDSPWVIEHPDWFISRPESPFPVYSFSGPDISPDSRVEIKIEDHYYDQTDAAVVFRLRHHRDGATRFVYHGNDGTSFAWNDTAQLDYSKHHVREHVIQTILHVARQFPIIRFDAAMVLAKRHVQRLWFPLPGAGGSIPSRAENAVSQEEFDALMPHEFWREVVDRVAAEVPGTLLLAEAFWLLEGYFVRTLGMHRVYNSAFMNMLRDEENAKYRSYLKKTIDFDPDILKRYVNFMSNPDERTAIDQFGSGDKYFGVCTMLSTLPGLPMIGHGQIEGFTERYGMEFKQARMDEQSNEGLIARHQHDIAPLLKNRRLFSESTHFALYDFQTEYGTVDENVFAYSNRLHDQRALIFYNNRYGSTRGKIHISAESMDKSIGSLRQTIVAQALALPYENSTVAAYRDRASGLEYLRRVTNLHHDGMSIELRAYQYAVLLDWRVLPSSADQPWDALCDSLGGRGVHSVDEALSKLRLRHVHETLNQAVSARNVGLFAKLGQEFTARIREAQRLEAASSTIAKKPAFPPKASVASSIKNPALEAQGPKAAAEKSNLLSASVTVDVSRLQPFLDKCQQSFENALQTHGAEIEDAAKEQSGPDGDEAAEGHAAETAEEHPQNTDLRLLYLEACRAMSSAAICIPYLEQNFSTAWPSAVRYMLPSDEPGTNEEQTWAPVLAWIVVRSIPAPGIRASLFEKLQLRSAFAEVFSSMGIEHGKTWRLAAQVRILLLLEDSPLNSMHSESFWQDPDVRWLAGVNVSAGNTYFNKEQFEELLCWTQLPALIALARQKPADIQPLRSLESDITLARNAAREAGYKLDQYLSVLEVDPSAQKQALTMHDKPAISVDPQEK